MASATALLMRHYQLQPPDSWLVRKSTFLPQAVSSCSRSCACSQRPVPSPPCSLTPCPACPLSSCSTMPSPLCCSAYRLVSLWLAWLGAGDMQTQSPQLHGSQPCACPAFVHPLPAPSLGLQHTHTCTGTRVWMALWSSTRCS